MNGSGDMANIIGTSSSLPSCLGGLGGVGPNQPTIHGPHWRRNRLVAKLNV
jgi:hypothetical protein